MKKIYMPAALCGALILGACEKPLDTVTLACGENNVTATVYRDKLVATIADRDVTLKITESADGAKYANENFALWNKGTEWILLETAGDAEQVISCTAQP